MPNFRRIRSVVFESIRNKHTPTQTKFSIVYNSKIFYSIVYVLLKEYHIFKIARVKISGDIPLDATNLTYPIWQRWLDEVLPARRLGKSAYHARRVERTLANLSSLAARPFLLSIIIFSANGRASK